MWCAREGDEGEVSEEAIGDNLSPAAWWSHRSNVRAVDDLMELHRLAVVPAAVAEPEAKDLDGRLRAVLLPLGLCVHAGGLQLVIFSSCKRARLQQLQDALLLSISIATHVITAVL